MPIVQLCENRYMNMYRTRLLPILVVDSCSCPCYNANTERKFDECKGETMMTAAQELHELIDRLTYSPEALRVIEAYALYQIAERQPEVPPAAQA